MPEIINEGILTNLANIYDATGFRTPEAGLVYDDKYRGGEAITCSKPDTIIFDTEEIRAGQLTGTYSIGFYYDSSTATVQGTPLMRFEIYEDGELMEENIVDYGSWTIYENDLNFMNYSYILGLHDTEVFKASSSYRIIVKTADTLTNDAILDYVTLARHGETGIVNTRPRMIQYSGRNAGNPINLLTQGAQLGVEVDGGTISGTLSADGTFSATFQYYRDFKSLAGTWVTVYDPAGKVMGSVTSMDTTNKTINVIFRNVSTSSWTGTDIKVQFLVIGYI